MNSNTFYCAGIAGLVLFHAHAMSQLELDNPQIEEHAHLVAGLLETLGSSIVELKERDDEHGVLNASGRNMLEQMVAIAEAACII